MSDVLAALDPPAVAGFYRRLADAVDARRGGLKVSLAALLMRKWLDNRSPKAIVTIEAPDHLRRHVQVKDALEYHRAVYLTEKKARVGGGATRWAGVVPRLQGKPPYQKWDGQRSLSMDYQSLVELPLRYQLTGNDADRDLLYALHGFQLKTRIVLEQERAGARPSSKIRLKVTSFETEVLDRYDWDYSEHLTVPNPDFGSSAEGAVEPDSETVRVYHRNAERIEKAGLAAPYSLRTHRWKVIDPALLATAEVDPARRL